MIVTIDGPAGTGKSTVARLLAQRLGFEFLNTGAMYRAVALVCVERAISVEDHAAVAAIPPTLTMLFRENRLLLDGRDVSEAIRTTSVTEVASRVASNPRVRDHLVELQRRAADQVNLVTEGRDQGTIVFPHAECKFFLTASPEIRAERRLAELIAQGQDCSLEEILADQTERDRRDEQRACAPLRPAEDAVVIDSSSDPIEKVLARMETIVRSRHFV
ncbi:MAG TPA: (d)CMP kinase [Planctomycetaceae bacterium]|jgi:cytidylate kinase|nr:(d)CMP kinase [Planctomycetaceae bacterium]